MFNENLETTRNDSNNGENLLNSPKLKYGKLQTPLLDISQKVANQEFLRQKWYFLAKFLLKLCQNASDSSHSLINRAQKFSLVDIFFCCCSLHCTLCGFFATMHLHPRLHASFSFLRRKSKIICRSCSLSSLS